MKAVDKKKKPIALLLLLLVSFFCFLSITCFDFLMQSPYQQVVSGEKPAALQVDIPFQPEVYQKDNSQQVVGNADNINGIVTEKNNCNSYEVELSLGGKIPLKTVQVQEVNPVYVIPGGQAVGILLQTNGVTVVGQSPVISEQGEALYPAKDAGIEIGDFIISMNGQKVNSNKEVAALIDKIGQAGDTLIVKLIRDKREQEIEMLPLFCADSKTYRIGIYVRDNTAGVGTMTFYDPQSGKYGALGHEISDLNGEGTTEHDKGSIVKATIQGIRLGNKGEPGEKIGSFMGGKWRGSIEKNCKLGIFGTVEEGLENPFFTEPIPVSLAEQVNIGDAEIYTVLEGEKIEKFSIKIIKILPNYRSSGKGMIIEVTDPVLLQKTGGIIQGMSGSPIVQNGQLVGAVTHVFVNDPHKGYACFAEWMLFEAGLLVE